MILGFVPKEVGLALLGGTVVFISLRSWRPNSDDSQPVIGAFLGWLLIAIAAYLWAGFSPNPKSSADYLAGLVFFIGCIAAAALSLGLVDRSMKRQAAERREELRQK